MKLVELTVNKLEEFREKVHSLEILGQGVAIISINKREVYSEAIGCETLVELVYDIFYWEVPLVQSGMIQQAM